MLEKMREGATGIFAKIVLGLVILSFAFAGVGSYISAGSEIPAVVVNGEEISERTVERAYQNERARMEAQLGEMFSQLAANPEYMSNFRSQITERLVSEKLLDQMAKDVGLRVSDNEVRQAIFDMPAFQLGGRFDNERFQQMIRQSGLQVHEFRDLMRADLTRRQLSEAVLTSEFALPGEASNAVKLQNQTRDVRFVNVPKDNFIGDLTITDQERQDYYNANISDFDTEEMVKVEYVELNVEQLIPTVDVTAEEVREYYDANSSRYREEEQRRVAHILIEAGDDEDAAKADAQGLLDIARTGADFGSLAKENSADTFSAENGGDLDWIMKGQMDPAFEEAAFGLSEVGQISDVIQSEFGFHIIKLTDLKAEQVSPFADVQADIKGEIELEKATEEFFRIQTEMENLAYENPESLEDVAAAANTEVQSTEFFTRHTAPLAVSNGLVVETVFSEQAIDEKLNSEVLSLDNSHVMVVRVTEHQPKRTQNLDEVQAQVDEALIAQKAIEAAKAWAMTLQETVENAGDIDAKLQEQELAWEEHAAVGRNSGALNSEMSSALFKLSPTNKFDVVELINGDVALIELQKVNQAENLDATEVMSFGQRLAMQQGNNSFQKMLDALKEQSEVEYSSSSNSDSSDVMSQ